MEVFELLNARHSVRAFNDRKIEPEVVNTLQGVIEDCNKESGLHIQLILDEPNAFKHILSRIQKFRNAKNYIALIGKNTSDLNSKIGYYGEKIVLKATELGLGTCWVVMTYSKKKCAGHIAEDEKRVAVIALGYFDKDGVPHKTKSIEELSRVEGEMPDWFRRGMEAARLAPTGKNHQNFLFSLKGKTVTAIAKRGAGTDIDLGIVKYHFELGAGSADWKWAE